MEELRAQQARLSALRVPDGVEKLDADFSAGRVGLENLKVAEQVAEDADTAARDELSGGPQRAPLELAKERRAEYARLAGRHAGTGRRGYEARRADGTRLSCGG